MKIKKVEVTNFRNLKKMVLDFPNPKTAIIDGQNGLGKSNLLNGINWVVSDCLLTDNYGKGENDIDSIVPIDAIKGEHTEVSIYLYDDVNGYDGAKFTKVYKTAYSKADSKANGHHNEYFINDAKCNNATEFYDALYGQLKFTKAFTKLKCNEVRLMTDPLYALMKLDYKELRQLLVAMGCTVTNEELYQMGFADMRAYESKYLGNWSNMRKACKDEVKTISNEIEQREAQLKLYNEVEQPLPSKVKELQETRANLVDELKKYQNAGKSEIIANKEKELETLNNEILQEQKQCAMNVSERLRAISQDKASKIANIEILKAKAINTHSQAYNDKKAIFDGKNNELANINLRIATINKQIITFNSIIDSVSKTKADAEKQLVEVQNAKYTGREITCPYCMEHFNDPEMEQHFETEKQERLVKISQSIMEYNKAIKENQLELEGAVKEKENKELLAQDLTKEVEALRVETENLKQVRDNAANNFDDSSIKLEIEKLDAEANALRVEIPTSEKLETLIKDKEILTQEIETAKANEIVPDYSQEINSLKEEINGCDEEIKQAYINQEKWETKQNLVQKIDTLRGEYNDACALLSKVTAMIHCMVQLINDKAEKITGIKFVMLQENLTNEDVTETCYAEIDGVPFKDLNTSKKIEVGCKFIEKVREIAHNLFNTDYNELPILADRLEGIDTLEKINNLTKYQLIGTRVSTNAQINAM